MPTTVGHIDFLAGRGGSDVRNSKAQDGTGNGDNEHDDTDQPQPVSPGVEHETARRRTGNDGHEGAHLQDAIRPGQIAVRKDLRQNAVFGGAEKSCLKRDEEQHGVGDLEAPRHERNQSKSRGDDLERLGHDQDGSLAVYVRELAGVAGKQQERQDEDRTDDRELATGVRARGRMNGDHRNDDLEQVVIERAQELRPEEGLQPTMFKRVAVAVTGHL
jgi:hypothetical protein